MSPSREAQSGGHSRRNPSNNKASTLDSTRSNTSKTLAAVSHIVAKGHRVVFGPNNCYIEIADGKRVPIQEENGDYVIDVDLHLGDEEFTAANNSSGRGQGRGRGRNTARQRQRARDELFKLWTSPG